MLIHWEIDGKEVRRSARVVDAADHPDVVSPISPSVFSKDSSQLLDVFLRTIMAPAIARAILDMSNAAEADSATSPLPMKGTS